MKKIDLVDGASKYFELSIEQSAKYGDSPLVDFMSLANDFIDLKNNLSLTPLEHSRLRESALANLVVAMAVDMGVNLKRPLSIDSRGEFSLIAINKDVRNPDYGKGGFGDEFSEALTRHNGRTGINPGAIFTADSGWAYLNHFAAENMVLEYKDVKVLEENKAADLILARAIFESRQNAWLADATEESMSEGRILGATEHYVVQNLGRNAIIHAKSELSEIPEVGKIARIDYKDGVGHVEVKDKNFGIER